MVGLTAGGFRVRIQCSPTVPRLVFGMGGIRCEYVSLVGNWWIIQGVPHLPPPAPGHWRRDQNEPDSGLPVLGSPKEAVKRRFVVD